MPRVTITVPEKNAQPYRFQLDRQSVTLGRGSDNDIPIDCGSVSVKHAEMRRIGGGYELRDVGSTNGIKLADERYEIIPLRSGISVKLGDVVFDFMLTDEEQEILAHEKPDDEAPAKREPEKSSPRLPPLKDLEEPYHPKPAPMPVNREMSGYGMLLVLILALIAFCIGMSIRFHKDTDRSLMDAIKANRKTMSAPGKNVPATAPDAASPDATTPDATAPDGTAPDTTTPPATTPDAPAPDAPVPDPAPAEPAPAATEPAQP
jgi:pSer/pThr/pTyr-binding forkhead associated (FHA) protein